MNIALGLPMSESTVPAARRQGHLHDGVNFSATALVLPYQKLDDIVGSSRLQSFGKRKGGKKS